MELYAKPIVTTTDGGIIRVDIQPITPDYIEARLGELDLFRQMDYSARAFESMVQAASSHRDKLNALKCRFGFLPFEAEYLLGLTVWEKKDLFNKEYCEAEIARWEALRKAIAVQ